MLLTGRFESGMSGIHMVATFLVLVHSDSVLNDHLSANPIVWHWDKNLRST
jgi:hypothetical protein